MRRRLSCFALVVVASIAFSGCSKLTRPATNAGPEAPAWASGAKAKPRDAFVPGSDHPYFPLVPGTTYHYRSQTDEGLETEELRVTRETKLILGVRTRVVEDIVRLDGVVTEHTFDWYAQDHEGNVWYFGEDSKTFDPETGELIGTEGSWEAGKDGAAAGIIMKAHPEVGDVYREEQAPGVAEDMARVLSLDARVTVPAGRFKNCMQTENFTPLEPEVLEHKFYAPGIGLVREVDVAGGGTENVLVRITRDRSKGDDDEDGDKDRKGNGKDKDKKRK